MSAIIFAFIGGVGFQELIVLLVLFLLPAILWIWAIIDLLRSTFASDTNKLIWALVIIFIPFIGSLLYLVIGRRQKVVS